MNKKKRTQLLLLVVGTLLMIFFVWNYVIRTRQMGLKAKEARILELQEKIETAKRGVKLAEGLRQDLDISRLRLHAVEESMANGDLYRWVINVMQHFQNTFEVEITDFDPPEQGDSEELPRVGYQAGTFAIIGTARFHDFGLFLAEIENQMPFVQLRKLELSSSASPTETIESRDKDILTFHMEFVTLVKPSESERER